MKAVLGLETPILCQNNIKVGCKDLKYLKFLKSQQGVAKDYF